MKKINIIFLSVILALAMTACNGGKNNASNQTEKQTESIMATEEAKKGYGGSYQDRGRGYAGDCK